jgi:hypothetical protein
LDARHCNRIIDAAATRVTHAMPPPDLRARILARVAVERRHAWFWTWVPVTAFGILVAGAAGTFVLQRAVSADFPVVVQRAAVGAHIAGVRPGSDAVRPGPKTGASFSSGESTASEASQMTNKAEPAPPPALLAWRARALAALPTAEDLALSDIQPEAIGVTQLEVKPLAGAVPFEGASDSGGVQ